MYHPSNWTTCPLLIFFHVSLLSSMDGGAPGGHSGHMVQDIEVWRHDSLEEMVHDGREGRNFQSFIAPK
jgi:hypothetical protein